MSGHVEGMSQKGRMQEFILQTARRQEEEPRNATSRVFELLVAPEIPIADPKIRLVESGAQGPTGRFDPADTVSVEDEVGRAKVG